MLTLDELVTLALKNLTGTIGKFQSRHFAIVQKEEEIGLLPGSIFFQADLDHYFTIRPYSTISADEKERKGTFYMARDNLNIPLTLDYYSKRIQKLVQEQTTALTSLNDLLQANNRQQRDVTAKMGKDTLLARLFGERPEDSLRKLKDRARELQTEFEYKDHWNQNIRHLRHCQEFYSFLGKRYEENSVGLLIHYGPENQDSSKSPLFDNRPMASSTFVLYGKVFFTEYLFKLAHEQPNDFLWALREMCRRTPYMASVSDKVVSMSVDEQREYRKQNYVLFNTVRRLCLVDAMKNERYDQMMK